MLDEQFIRDNLTAFENFWNRRVGDSIFRFTCAAYGYTVELETNHESIIRAARLAAPRYCESEALPAHPSLHLFLFVSPSITDSPVPENFPAQIQTVAADDFLLQAFTPHLQAFADLRQHRAYAFLSSALASDSALVSRYIIDRFVLNILLREGLGQLHATCLVKDKRAVLLIAPHGTGKSTTAFRLLNAGWKLMGDSLVFARRHGDEFELLGYPIGEGKLTRETAELFPELRARGIEVTVHDVRKNLFELRDLLPDKIRAHSIFPERIDLLLTARDASGITRIEKLSPEAALNQILPDTIYLDELDAMAQSLGVIRALIERANCWRLNLGANPNEIVHTIENL